MKIDKKELIVKIQEMKPFPRVALKILELANDDKSNMKDIVDLVMTEQVIAARVLKLCNSAYFGLLQPVSSLHQAVTLIGLDNLVKITLMIFSSFQNSRKSTSCVGYQMFPSELWRHSVSCAFCSQKILREGINNGSIDSSLEKDKYTIFTACLLHDMGKLVLSDYMYKRCVRVDKLIMAGCKDKLQIERILLETDHAEIGGLIAKSWDFPAPLINMIRNHHRGMVSNNNPVFNFIDADIIVNFTNLFIKTLDVFLEGTACHIQPLLLKKFGFSLSTIETVRMEVESELKKSTDFLNFVES